MLIFSTTLGHFFIRLNESKHPTDVNFHIQILFLKCLKTNQLTHTDSRSKGGRKCPPSCQLGQKQLLLLFSECVPAACTGANRVCDGSLCKCGSGFVENPSVSSPGPTDDCVAGRKTLTTDEANPQVSKDLEKCQKSHISS